MTDEIEADYGDANNFRLLRDGDDAGGEADDFIGDNDMLVSVMLMIPIEMSLIVVRVIMMVLVMLLVIMMIWIIMVLMIVLMMMMSGMRECLPIGRSLKLRC